MNTNVATKHSKLPFPGWQALEGQLSFKYAGLLDAARNSTGFIANLLTNEMPTIEGYKHIVCDVKIVELKEGEWPCLPGWHYDCVTVRNHKSQFETHFIWEFGADCYTEFSDYRIICPETYQDLIEQMPGRTQYEPGFVYKYGRTLHRPNRAGSSGRRVLVRKTHTDLIRPIPIRSLSTGI